MGESCNDASCFPGLACVSGFCTSSFGLGVGASCNSSAADGGCGSAFDELGLTTPLRCLPKGNSFACQFEQGLFGSCGVETNSACAEGLTCDNAESICLVSQ